MTDMPQTAEQGRNSDDRRETNASQSGRSKVNATGVLLIPVDGQSDGAAILWRGSHAACDFESGDPSAAESVWRGSSERLSNPRLTESRPMGLSWY